MTLRTITFDDEQWQVVPREPTERMILELMAVGLRNAEYANEGPTAKEIAQGYACMCSVAPEPPAQQPMTAEQVADLVARLRTMSATGWHPIGDEAANEIERLRAAQQPMTDAATDVLAERRRQVEVEGWAPERDDHEHDRGQLACAAGCYALHSALMMEGYPDAYAEKVPAPWPWSPEWWKPKDARRNLVKAGALILAEIERLDRIDKGESSPPRPICGNCDTPVPPGCKGIFVSDGDHCALNYKEGSNAG